MTKFYENKLRLYHKHFLNVLSVTNTFMNNVLISPVLAKAARALLEWHQSDLASAAGLSLTAINNFERKKGVTRKGTIQTIAHAFHNNGIEFLAGGGLRLTDDIAFVSHFKGETFIHEWTKQIMTVVSKHGEEILTASCDEHVWYQPQNKKVNNLYLAWAEEQKLQLKSLVPDNQKVMYRSWRKYRAIPSAMIGRLTYCIYGDYLAFVIWNKKQVIVLRNTAIVETFRNQFKYLWKIGTPVWDPNSSDGKN